MIVLLLMCGGLLTLITGLGVLIDGESEVIYFLIASILLLGVVLLGYGFNKTEYKYHMGFNYTINDLNRDECQNLVDYISKKTYGLDVVKLKSTSNDPNGYKLTLISYVSDFHVMKFGNIITTLYITEVVDDKNIGHINVRL